MESTEKKKISLLGQWYEWHLINDIKMTKRGFLNILFVGNYSFFEQSIYEKEVIETDSLKRGSDYEIFISEKNLEIVKESLHKYIVNYIIHNKLAEDLKEMLIYALKETDIHNGSKCERIIRILKKISIEDDEALTEVLYFYIYFAITDYLHEKMAYENYDSLEKDIKEYTENVLLSVGSSGIPGMSKLYALANKNDSPNIIALYEMGELEYYGRGPSGNAANHFEEAYGYYKATLELNEVHPLALWSIAYIMFNYKRENTELENAIITELDDYIAKQGKNRNWYMEIIYNVEESYAYGCAAAANLIGKIIDAPEELFPTKYKISYRYKKAEDYYKESAMRGYMYGMNNYAQKLIEKANNLSEKENEYYSEALKYLKQSADMGEPWAANKMGLYYLKGLYIKDKVIIKKDLELSFYYFKKSFVMSGMRNNYWACLNLFHYYYNNLDSGFYNREESCKLWEIIKNNFDYLSDEQKDLVKKWDVN